MKILTVLSVVLLGAATACDNKQSLQEYYVENQGSKDFVALDIPTSLMNNSENLNPDQQKTLETIKKINVLAIPKNAENVEKIEVEKTNIDDILKDEKYQLLMKFGSGETKMEVYFTGDDEAIDEIIVYGFNDTRGLGIARVLGEDMNPSDIINLVKSFEKGDVNIDGLSGVTKMFIEKTE